MGAETDAAMINAASQTLNNALSYAATSNINRRTQRYNREMYDRQRADALTDWNRQNEYNSPQAQMARLKAAGLNPNLVYGHGADATSTAMPRSVTENSWNPDTPRFNFDAGSVLGSYYDAKVKEQTIDNLEAQKRSTDMDILLKAAQRTATLAGVDRIVWEIERGKGLYPSSLQMQELGVKKILQDMDIQRQTNYRAAQMQAQQILSMVQERAKGVLSMEQMKHGIELLKKDERIKELDAQFADKGTRPNDSLVWKIVGDIVAKMTGKSIWDLLK